MVVVDTKDYIENLEGEVIGDDSYRETDGDLLNTRQTNVSHCSVYFRKSLFLDPTSSQHYIYMF